MRRLPAALLLPLLLGHASTAPPARAEDGVLAAPIRALLADPRDETLMRVYLGISKGLEQAGLPRIRREELGEEGGFEAALGRLTADPPPLLFVIGQEAARQLDGREVGAPLVYVDTAWLAGEETIPPTPRLPSPVAVVRGVVQASRLGEVLREGFPGRAPVRVAFTAELDGGPALEVVRAASLALALPGERADVLLHVRLGDGGGFPSLEAAVERAQRERSPLLAAELGAWPRGAAILLLPDLHLLGRVAADAGRRLLAGEAPVPAVRRVGTTEVRVDLEAAAAQGWEPPLPFLAGADVLRRPLGPGRR